MKTNPFCMSCHSRISYLDSFDSTRYKVGECFLHMPHPRAMKRLEADQATLDARVSELQSTAEECEKGMKELKVVLYAKFGSSINLDEVRFATVLLPPMADQRCAVSGTRSGKVSLSKYMFVVQWSRVNLDAVLDRTCFALLTATNDQVA
jgi:hypothetical protein